MAEIARLRQELGELTERMRTLEATAADKGREVEEARARADEAENGWSASQREVSKLRVELTGAAAERDELLEKLKEADAGRIAALANADALRRVEQLRVEEKERREAEEARAGTEMEPADAAVDSEFGGAGGEAETAVQGAADQLWVAAERAARWQPLRPSATTCLCNARKYGRLGGCPARSLASPRSIASLKPGA